MSSQLCSVVSLFSVCGGSDLGSEEAGIEVVWANEIDPTACELYELVTGTNGVINPGNVAGVRKFPKADLLIGCYPCQGYSQGGRRDSGDKINYLYREFDRALRQIKPLAFIVENVDGISFSNISTLLRNKLTR